MTLLGHALVGCRRRVVRVVRADGCRSVPARAPQVFGVFAMPFHKKEKTEEEQKRDEEERKREEQRKEDEKKEQERREDEKKAEQRKDEEKKEEVKADGAEDK